MKKITLRFLTFFILGNSIYATPISKPDEFKIEYIQSYGKIDGFVQIPKGGKKGTTSLKKPTFHDLGIDNITYPQFKLKTRRNNLHLFAEFIYKTFNGSEYLKEDIISHDKLLAKTSKLKTEHEYINYALGMGYDIFKTNNIEITPILEFTATDFKYKYTCENVNENTKFGSQRDFGFGSLHIGINSTYIFTSKYKINLNIKSAIPFDSVRKWWSINLLNSYTLYQKNSKELNLIFGIGVQEFEYRDTQEEMQNFMKYKLSPTYSLGLEYKF